MFLESVMCLFGLTAINAHSAQPGASTNLGAIFAGDPGLNFLGKTNLILDIVPREGWHAKPPVAVEPMSNPVPYVIIHHSYQPPACYSSEECIKAMQWMQDLHQINNSWNDIGYHFAVGGDNRAYEGRGWSRVGAHAPNYNNISIGICVIGDWRDKLPPIEQLKVILLLIDYGVANGYIRPDYKLMGHRQVRDTECPGDTLFAEIKTWEHWVEGPQMDFYNRPKNLDNDNNGSGGDKKVLKNDNDRIKEEVAAEIKKLKGFFRKKL